MEDWNLHPRSLHSILEFILTLDTSKQNILSFCNHGYLFDNRYISDLCLRFNIAFTQSVIINTSDDIDLYIKNPGTRTKKFLREFISLEKQNWLLLVLETLVEKGSIIPISNMIYRTEKTLEQIEIFDIVSEIVLYENSNNNNVKATEIFETQVKDIIKKIPRKLPSIDFVIQSIEGEFMYICATENNKNTTKFNELLNNNKNIYGVVTDTEKIKVHGINVLHGSGKWV